MLGDGQAIVHFLTDHYEKEVARQLYPIWYHYYRYVSDHYAEIDSYVVNSQAWINQITELSYRFNDRLFFYSKLPILHQEQKERFLSSIHQRLEDEVAIGLCLPHTLGEDEEVLGLWENTTGNHMRLHIRKPEIPFGFVVVDNHLYFERPTQADDSKRHIYHVKGVKEETVAYLLKNPQIKMPKMLQNYFLL